MGLSILSIPLLSLARGGEDLSACPPSRSLWGGRELRAGYNPDRSHRSVAMGAVAGFSAPDRYSTANWPFIRLCPKPQKCEHSNG